MQDRYVGDVGDFGKYGLLRLLAQQTSFRLGVIWYLYGDESHNADGRHVSYLSKPEFALPDSELHSKLDSLVRKNKRSVRAVERAGILPPDTIFFGGRISDPDGQQLDRRLRAASRLSWLKRAVRSSAEADFVFFDPDNGIETASVQRHSPKSGKYIYWEELMPFWQRGQSLVIYHHLNRTAPIARQANFLREKFKDRFPDAGLLRFFLFRRGSCRHFWLVAQERHVEAFENATNALLQSYWREYFEVG
jgi:hypothetical protein